MGADIAELAEVVRGHIELYGSAPNFRSEHPRALKKAHNYIRVAAKQPSAPEALIEAVRCRLGGRR
jgi:hypothetical protein